MKMSKRRIYGLLYEIIMVSLVLMMFYPVVMMIIVSLKKDTLMISEPLSMQTSFDFSNYVKAFMGMDYITSFINSFTLTTISTLMCVLLGGSAAYAIVRVKKGKIVFTCINIAFLISMTLPAQAAMVPLVLWMQKLGLGNTLPGLILAFIGANAAYSVFFFSGFINTVPKSLEEAAHIDGATPMQSFVKIVLPLLKPAMITMAIIITLRVWNNFMYPLILLQGKSSRTLPLTVFFFKGDFSVQWNVLFAATTLSMLPLMIIYFILQKQVIAGMTSGSVKG